MTCLLILVSCIFAVALAAPSKRQFGICVEMCSVRGSGLSCPAGTVCKSNGCGHTCQKTHTFIDKNGCDFSFMALCDLYCPNGGGFAKDANGCPLCRCATNTNILLPQINALE